MPYSNKHRGSGFERRRLNDVKKNGGWGFRAFGSKGIVDLVYIDGNGVGHLEQLKFSSKGKARISKAEMERLKMFAKRWDGKACHVSVVIKNAWKEPEVIKLNE